MKVYNLCCEFDHPFEGWFSSEDDFVSQSANLLIACPTCESTNIKKLPSAPRLNLSGARASTHNPAVAMQSAWLNMARQLIANTEDVGNNFTEEARRIHYKEVPERAIRGVATSEQRDALIDEGIEVSSFAIPAAFKQSLQ
jgi:hypothetical protein